MLIHHREKFLHDPRLIFMILIVKIHIPACIFPVQLIVDKIFKRRQLAHQDVADKCGAQLGGGGHVGGGLLVEFQDDIRVESGIPAQPVSAEAGVVSGHQHNKGQSGKCVERHGRGGWSQVAFTLYVVVGELVFR